MREEVMAEVLTTEQKLVASGKFPKQDSKALLLLYRVFERREKKSFMVFSFAFSVAFALILFAFSTSSIFLREWVSVAVLVSVIVLLLITFISFVYYNWCQRRQEQIDEELSFRGITRRKT